MPNILYSFPWEIGASGIGYTAWAQVNELNRLDVNLHLLVGNIKRNFDGDIFNKMQSMSIGSKKIPAKLFGGMDNAAAFHDFKTAQYIKKNHTKIDVFHCWPTASEKSLKVAKEFKIPTFLERPNAHTEFAYAIVKKIYNDLGLPQNKKASHTAKKDRLLKEEREYKLADYLLCPSDFVAKTFIDRGYPSSKLVRHQYGYDPARIQLSPNRTAGRFKIIFIGNDAPRKGLHNILQAWQNSIACKDGEFHIFGSVDDAYRAHIRGLLKTQGVTFHGFSPDVGKHLNTADCFVLSSFEEGSALVTYEARAAGCVLLVSDATGAVVKHGVNGLVHEAGNVQQLTEHLNLLYQTPARLQELHQNSISDIDNLTWAASAKMLLNEYVAKINQR